MNKLLIVCGVCLLVLSPLPGLAKVCDYRPSAFIGGVGSGATAAAGTAVAGAGVAAKAVGFYTLTHAVTGATMAGLTTAGASAAGTVGILAGTGGVIGTSIAVITSPITITVGAVVAVGVGAYEGACYFAADRITNPAQVLPIVRNIASKADPQRLRIINRNGVEMLRVATALNEQGRPIEWENYEMEKLYIVDGVLKYDGWFNKTIGHIGFVPTSN